MFYNIVQCTHLYKNSHINKSVCDEIHCCSHWKSLRKYAHRIRNRLFIWIARDMKLVSERSNGVLMRFCVTDKYNFWFGLKPQAKATIKKNQRSKADQSRNWIKDMQLCIHYCWENVQQYQETKCPKSQHTAHTSKSCVRVEFMFSLWKAWFHRSRSHTTHSRKKTHK